MSNFLVVYASTHGHTAKIAARLADGLRAGGHEVVVHALGSGDPPSPVGHDVAILAASVHATKYQREAVRWAARHAPALTAMPSVFLSVSLTAAEDSAGARERLAAVTARFVEQTGWSPARVEHVAGALQYREYNFLMRRIMRRIVKSMGHPEPDTSRDHDYTDWARVEALAHELAGSGSRQAVPS